MLKNDCINEEASSCKVTVTYDNGFVIERQRKKGRETDKGKNLY